MVEYALILLLIAMAVVLVMTVLGEQTSSAFSTVTGDLAGSAHGGGSTPSPGGSTPTPTTTPTATPTATPTPSPTEAQTIWFGTSPALAAVGTTYAPSAYATSGLPVVFDLDGASSGCTFNSGLISFTAAGSCILDANQAGDSTYAAAPEVQQTMPVSDWTAFGGPTSLLTGPGGVSVTAPGSTGDQRLGGYVTAPDGAFTVTVQATASYSSAGFQDAVLFVGPAGGPGDTLNADVDSNGWTPGGVVIGAFDCASPTTGSCAVEGYQSVTPGSTYYLQLTVVPSTVDSSAQVTVSYSTDGVSFTPLTTYTPSFTIGSVGVGADDVSGSPLTVDFSSITVTSP